MLVALANGFSMPQTSFTKPFAVNMTSEKLLPQISLKAVKLSCTIDNNWRVEFHREAHAAGMDLFCPNLFSKRFLKVILRCSKVDKKEAFAIAEDCDIASRRPSRTTSCSV